MDCLFKGKQFLFNFCGSGNLSSCQEYSDIGSIKCYFHTIILIGITQLFIKRHGLIRAIKDYLDATQISCNLCRMQYQFAANLLILISFSYANILNMADPSAAKNKLWLD